MYSQEMKKQLTLLKIQYDKVKGKVVSVLMYCAMKAYPLLN